MYCVDCTTVDGLDCIFPFTYLGRTFDGCTDFDDTARRLWCSNEVNIKPNLKHFSLGF